MIEWLAKIVCDGEPNTLKPITSRNLKMFRSVAISFIKALRILLHIVHFEQVQPTKSSNAIFSSLL